jgi:hypothetical protein
MIGGPMGSTPPCGGTNVKIRLLFLALFASAWTASAQTSIAIINPDFIHDQVKCSAGQLCSKTPVGGIFVTDTIVYNLGS